MNGEITRPVHRVFHYLSTFSVDKKKELLFYGSLNEFTFGMRKDKTKGELLK